MSTPIAAILNPVLVEGETANVEVEVFTIDTGDCGRTAYDLTGASAVTLEVRPLDGSLAASSLALGTLDGPNGRADFPWAAIPQVGKWTTELRFTLAGETRRLAAGRIAVKAAVA